jgi:ribonuclease BN (tRNA processing enzyme)
MKPGHYRGASAIYYVSEQRGILMDCAEGSYGQIMDHFGDPAKTDDVLLKTKVIFITHIHGDHQLGILKILQERDRLMVNEKNREFGKIYAVIPTPMFKYIQVFINENIRFKDLIVLVKSKDLNPESNHKLESVYYYQKFNQYKNLHE